MHPDSHRVIAGPADGSARPADQGTGASGGTAPGDQPTEHDDRTVRGQPGQIVLGTMLFGTRTGEDVSRRLLDRFLELGGRWLDTADCYAFWAHPDGGYGHSERLLGRWLAANPSARQQVRISTKLRFAPVHPGTWPANAAGLSAEAVHKHFAESCDRLGIDRVDVLWAHGEDRAVPLEQTVEALGTIAATGRAGRLGASNHATWAVERARRIAVDLGVPGYTMLQRRHTVLTPRPGVSVDDGHTLLTSEDRDYAEACDLDVWVYTPLLNGGYTRPDKPLHQGYGHPGSTRVLDVLTKIAAELEASVNQVVLAWLMQGAVAYWPIVGVSRVEQLEEAMQARELHLSAEHFSRIEAAR
ncbi:MAG: aldo/keto reductase [Actinomycetales bacterium]